MNLSDSLRIQSVLYPDRDCVICEDRKVTFSQLNTRANKIAHALKGLGLKRGDAVAVLLHNGYEWMEIFHALARMGMPLVPVNYHFTPREIQYIVNHSECKALIYGEAFKDRIETAQNGFDQVPENRLIHLGETGPGHAYEEWLGKGASDEAVCAVDESDVLYLAYTSGTTGFPKGAQAMNGSRMAHALLFCHEFHITGRDRTLVNMPIFHSNALAFSTITLYLGGSVVIMPKFDAEKTLYTIDTHHTTASSMVPTQYERIFNLPDSVKSGYDVSSMRRLICSSSLLNPKTRQMILSFFPQADLYEFYGSSEAGVVTLMLPEDHEKKPSSVGQPAFLQQVKLLDDDKQEVEPGRVGELFSRSIMPFAGYFKMPEATAEAMHDGFFSAGDMAYRDEDGYYFLTDRKKDMIISGAENIYPAEIEQVLLGHPDVAEVAVIGVPDERWGEVPKALVIKKPDTSVTDSALLDFCRDRLAKYKTPKSLEFVEAFPKTALGKIIKRQLREKYWEGHKIRIS